jgi:uncharacterized protein (TIGR03435 family)
MRQTLLSAGIAVLATLAFGQATENLMFEVASIKPAAPPQPGGRSGGGPARGGPGTADPGRITWSNATVKRLLMTAYEVKDYQVNGPGWLDTQRYDIIAKVPEDATQEQVNVMWQTLLKERFGVVVHHESKEFQVDELVVTKGGSKLRETTLDPNAPIPQPGTPRLKNGELIGAGLMLDVAAGSSGPIGHMAAKAQPISALATMLGNQLGHPVVDKTGLTGKYDFAFEFTPDLKGPGTDASAPGSSLVGAIQQQLGLRLVPGKAKLDVIVVDKADKVPTDN